MRAAIRLLVAALPLLAGSARAEPGFVAPPAAKPAPVVEAAGKPSLEEHGWRRPGDDGYWRWANWTCRGSGHVTWGCRTPRAWRLFIERRCGAPTEFLVSEPCKRGTD
jgi:hypothetical protein